MKHVLKVVGTHAAINAGIAAGVTILVDAYKLIQAPAKAAVESAAEAAEAVS